MDIPVYITLTSEEMEEVTSVGISRNNRALSDGRIPMHGVEVKDERAHITGALGEYALANHFGLPWMGDLGHPDRGIPDVGGCHVRTVVHRLYDRMLRGLLLHEEDADDEPFVLVMQVDPSRFRIVGWRYAHEGKHPYYWWTKTDRPCYRVPQEDLRPMSDLPDRFSRLGPAPGAVEVSRSR
jgi:hypothetical protein